MVHACKPPPLAVCPADATSIFTFHISTTKNDRFPNYPRTTLSTEKFQISYFYYAKRNSWGGRRSCPRERPRLGLMVINVRLIGIPYQFTLCKEICFLMQLTHFPCFRISLRKLWHWLWYASRYCSAFSSLPIDVLTPVVKPVSSVTTFSSYPEKLSLTNFGYWIKTKW